MTGMRVDGRRGRRRRRARWHRHVHRHRGPAVVVPGRSRCRARFCGGRQTRTERVGSRIERRLGRARTRGVLGGRCGEITARARRDNQADSGDDVSTHDEVPLLTREPRYAYTEIVGTGQPGSACDLGGHSRPRHSRPRR